MRGKMLERIHESHMGIEKSKRRARDIMFWPRMNEQIEAIVSKCKTCQEYQRTHGARNNTIETLGNGRN
jgi:ribosomal protein L32